jgi:hypothetical protein
MANITDVCQEIVSDVDGSLACAVVDLSSGLLLGVHHNVPYFSQSYLDAVAAAAVDMFRGKAISTVENMIGNLRGSTIEKTIQEVQMSTTNTYHFMVTVPDRPDSLAILITTKKINLGMGWAGLRRALPNLTPMCP